VRKVYVLLAGSVGAGAVITVTPGSLAPRSVRA